MKLPSLVDFLNASPSAFHSTQVIRETLLANDYTCLDEREEWKLIPGNRYFVVRNDSSILAFNLAPLNPLAGARLAICHTDSPSLKLRLKDAQPLEGGLLSIPVEVYGGATIAVWLDRTLCVAGRACFRDAQGDLQIKLVDCPQVLGTIPNPPPHLVDLNGGFKYNPQKHLAAVFPYATLQEFVDALTPEDFPCQDADSFQGELYLADEQGAALMGAQDQLVQAAHLDNLTSCFSILSALCAVPAPTRTVLGAFFDLEEVGNNYQSAGSNFLQSTLARIVDALGGNAQSLPRMMADTICLSVDVAHAFHPNFPEFFDKPMSAILGKGPTLKYHANQNFATTLPSAALLKEIAKEIEAPLQEYTPRSDGRCGSTIGRVVATNLGVPTVDMGVPIWAMHSIRETCSTQDVIAQAEIIAAFFA